MTTTDAQSAQGDSKPSMPSPPPTYAQVVAARKPPVQAQPPAPSQPHPNSIPIPTTNTNTNTNAPFGQPTPASPPPRTYGPTPLPNAPAGRPETTAILPYYDPRSQWALRAAASRARWRFFAALFWGCVIWAAVGSLIGGVVDSAGRRSRRHHGSWAVE